MNKNKYIDLEEQVYFLIHSIDCNIKPSILSIGSMLFKFVMEFNGKYIIDTEKAREYIKNNLMFSEENMCTTYYWLKDNRFIYYSDNELKYFLTDKIIKQLNLK